MNVHTHIHTEGNKRWLVLKWAETPKGEVELRERWPLHMDKLEPEKRKWFMEQAAARMHEKMKKQVGVK